MNVRWRFGHCTDAQKSAVREYLQRKLPRLDRLLSRYATEQRQLDLTVHRNPVRHSWDLRAVLRLPTGTLVTDACGAEQHSIVDEVIEELARQIQRHKATVRREHLRRRRQRQLVDQRTAMPFLQSDFESHRTPAFFILLKPLLKSVRDHAQRELKILELEGAIPIGEVTADDLVDDVLVAAWEAFDERPHHTPLDVWLVGILHERLNELQQQCGDVTLSIPIEHASAEDFDADNDDLNFWLSRSLEPSAEVTLEDIIPDEASSEWWRELEDKDQLERLMQFLKQLPKHERQSFMLSEVEGFDLSEISFALDRSENEIAKDVERARSALRAMIERKPRDLNRECLAQGEGNPRATNPQAGRT